MVRPPLLNQPTKVLILEERFSFLTETSKSREKTLKLGVARL